MLQRMNRMIDRLVDRERRAADGRLSLRGRAFFRGAKDDFRLVFQLLTAIAFWWIAPVSILAEPAAVDAPAERAEPGASRRPDRVRDLQSQAISEGKAQWGHWGVSPQRYAGWNNHSNRLIPVYTFGISLDAVGGEHSPYRDAEKLRRLYGRLPDDTLNPSAEYFDQTAVYELQRQAAATGKKQIVLVVFDGMDWQTTRAAAIYRGGQVYDSGRGNGLSFQDYRGVPTDFGWFVTSPHNGGTTVDVDAQTVTNPGGTAPGGYNARLGGEAPWSRPAEPAYLIGKSLELKHVVTDSAASATSMTCGIKTYNDSINVSPSGEQAVPIARRLQAEGYAIGVVTSVPISHATPACAYANNVWRDDYQDLTRDLVGLPSVAHRGQALPGVDVLLGAGWGSTALVDPAQGGNFVPGNRYLTAHDLAAIDASGADAVGGGRYVVAQRTPGKLGADVLADAAGRAAKDGGRLFGFFGCATGHLPFRTADGRYEPTAGARGAEKYTALDRVENPTLADMTRAALEVLADRPGGFWLMIEAGDVDWANHDDNLDNSIGAVLSGDDALRALFDWIESRDAWQQTAVIVTSDHGHYLVLDQPEALLPPAAEVAK
jgi:alkaline phosphatase